MKNTYTVINMTNGKKFGTFTNKADAFKKRSFVRKMSKNPLPACGFSKNDFYQTFIIRNYVEVQVGDDPDVIEKINRENIVNR